MLYNTRGFALKDGIRHLLFGGELVTAIWAAVRVLEPLLDALVAKNMLAFWKSNRVFGYAFRITDAEFVVADDAR